MRRVQSPGAGDEVFGIDPFVIVVLAGWTFGFGLTAARLAIQRDRPASAWAVFGALLGPAALLMLAAAPPGRCRTCLTPTRGWLHTCAWCGSDPGARMNASARTTGMVTTRLTRPDEGDDVAPTVIRGSTASIQIAPRPSSPVVAQSRRSRVEPQRVSEIMVPAPARPESSALTTPSATYGTTRLPEPQADGARVLATAVYISGNVTMESGRRYQVTLEGPRLRFLGPVDTAPSAVALDRAVVDMEAIALDRRVLVSEPRARSGIALALMAVEGSTPERLADTITAAARTAARP